MSGDLRLSLERIGEANADALRTRLGAPGLGQPPDAWTESVPGLLVSETADPPPAAPLLDQFRLDAPLSAEGRLLAALVRRVDALTAEVRALRAPDEARLS
jgi:hypothetical protein